MKTWFDIVNKGNSTTIRIHDEIGGWGISAKDFITALDHVPKTGPVNLHINSPGGSVFDGTAIHNRLLNFGDRLTAHIDGLAASIASYIMLAAKKIIIPSNAFVMIHDPSGLVVGTEEDMTKMADVLRKMKGNLVTAYAKRTGKPEEEIAQKMSAESWFTGAEAFAYGLADEMTGAIEVTNLTVDPTKFTNLPESLKTAASTATNKKTSQMNKLIEKLVALKLIVAATLTEDEMVAQVEAAITNHKAILKTATDKAAQADTDLKAANAKLAETWVASAVASKRIKDDEQSAALWTSHYLSDSVQAQATLDSIAPVASTPVDPKAKTKTKPTGAHDPLPTNPGTGVDNILDRYNAMEEGDEKDAFLAKNGNQLLKLQRAAATAK